MQRNCIVFYSSKITLTDDKVLALSDILNMKIMNDPTIGEAPSEICRNRTNKKCALLEKNHPPVSNDNT